MCTTLGVKAAQPQTPRLSSRMRKQRFNSLLLDLATTIYVLHYLYKNPSYLNPWKLPNTQLWLLGFAFIRLGIIFYDHLVVIVIENCFHSKVLPTREPGAPPVRYVSLDTRSIVYLTLNAFNEYAFVMRLTHYLWEGGGHQQLLKWKLTEMTLGNTVIALGIMFVFMDMLYAPLHHMLHLPALYPLIHKHHHRQHYPTRGYLDAGNEHPIEHMIGTMCTWFALCVVEVLLPTCGMWIGRMKENGLRGMIEGGYSMPLTQGGGVHALTVVVFVQFHAALAMLNHSPYDVQFFLPCVGSSSICGAENTWFKRIITGQWFQYSVGYHEMHHRKFNFNYGQNCMLYDTLMGTFLNYEGPKSAAELGAKRGKELKEK